MKIVRGQSSPTGFLIEMSRPRGMIADWFGFRRSQKVILTTKDYRENEDVLPFSGKQFVVSLTAGISLFWLLETRFIDALGTLGALALGIIFAVSWLAAVGLFAVISMSKNSELRKWHGCEHKLIAVYCRKRPRTVAEIHKAWRVQINCGAGIAAPVLMFPLVLIFGLLMFSTSLGNTLGFVWFLYGVIVLSLASGMFIVSPLIQYFFTTATPDDAHVMSALELAARIDAET